VGERISNRVPGQGQLGAARRPAVGGASRGGLRFWAFLFGFFGRRLELADARLDLINDAQVVIEFLGPGVKEMTVAVGLVRPNARVQILQVRLRRLIPATLTSIEREKIDMATV
jgi:hypothetical protein